MKEPYPIGTWVECRIYEEYSEFGQISEVKWNEQLEQWDYLVTSPDGKVHSPWYGNSVTLLTKLERELL